MKERPIGQKFDQHISRRNFLKWAGYSTVTLAAYRFLPEGFILNEEKFGFFEKIDPKTRLELSKYSPVTIAHRGGNTVSRIKTSTQAAIDFVEADIRKVGRVLAIGHEKYWGPIAYDMGEKLIRLGGPNFLLEDLLTVTETLNQGVFLDIKETATGSINQIAEAISKHKLENQVTFSGNWIALDQLSELSGDRQKMFYSIENIDSLSAFWEEQSQRQAKGVAIETSLVSKENVSKFHQAGVKVYTYTVGNSEQALRLLSYDVDGLISNNLSLLGIWDNKAVA